MKPHKKLQISHEEFFCLLKSKISKLELQGMSLNKILAEIEIASIEAALGCTDRSLPQAADLLRVARTTLYNKCDKLKIPMNTQPRLGLKIQ